MEKRRRVGIKYCGGCNPTYERLDMIQQVQARWDNQFLFLTRYQKAVEGLVLMNGCPSACTLQNSNLTEIPYCSITGENELETLMDWLKSLAERKDF